MNTNSATWIWYPGDYEIWWGNRMNGRRTERGAFFPPFWKMDSHYVTVEFSRTVDLSEAEEIALRAEGTYNVKLDGKLQFGMPATLLLPAGRHQLNIKIWNQAAPPALYVQGRTVRSDASWRVTFEDKEWIDESGKASDTSATDYAAAGCWNFDNPGQPPSTFALERTWCEPAAATPHPEGVLYDFGRETFGYLGFEGLSGAGEVCICYGESPEEALDRGQCETLDRLRVEADRVVDLTTGRATALTEARAVPAGSKAFRYVWVVTGAGVHYDRLGMEYEYLPEVCRGSFRCDDEEVNRIWEVGAYTMQLTTREFFIDGIKRDRWVWSGDAIQSYLMNYYLFFDTECVKRTIWLLRGKDPVTSHVNTIMDYTFYWFMSIYDYYLYTGDRAFVEQIYPRMRTLMAYVLGRTDAEGLVEGRSGDWVFVDWADFPMSKQGALAFEQILFCRSLETMSLCAELAGTPEEAAQYRRQADTLRGKLLPLYWDEKRQALVHNIEQGVRSEAVNKFPNMFALTLGYLSAEQQRAVMEHVMLNEAVPKVTTPYMRFYELEAMCRMGRQAVVLPEIKAYWGGMLRAGATSFWEKYNPGEQGRQHLAMYGRPYGKSLCHAWGASPIYLLGRYYLGVQPLEAGYARFEIRPVLGGLRWMEGRVPTPKGSIGVRMDASTIRVQADEGCGYLWFRSPMSAPKASAGVPERMEEDLWRLWIEPRQEVTVEYAEPEARG